MVLFKYAGFGILINACTGNPVNGKMCVKDTSRGSRCQYTMNAALGLILEN